MTFIFVGVPTFFAVVRCIHNYTPSARGWRNSVRGRLGSPVQVHRSLGGIILFEETIKHIYISILLQRFLQKFGPANDYLLNRVKILPG
jgi:hypothetical protein